MTRKNGSPKIAPGDDARLVVGRPVACRLLGVSDRTFSRLESEGVVVALVPGTGRKQSTYDAAAVVASYLSHREQKLTGSLDNPRDAKDRSQAELNQLRLARERRELLPRGQVISEGQSYVTAAVTKLRAVPSRLVSAGVVAADRIQDAEEAVEEAVSEMARWTSALELLRSEGA